MEMAPKMRPASSANGGEAHGVRQKKSPKANRTLAFMNQKDEKLYCTCVRSHGRTAPGAHKLKWARCQGAVTIPWPRAHSILKRIGGDALMLRQLVEMSRKNQLTNCPPEVLHLSEIKPNYLKI